ncbi:MAG: hypothetical protein ABIS69_11580, partial [Sediminibacterium sp.]
PYKYTCNNEYMLFICYKTFMRSLFIFFLPLFSFNVAAQPKIYDEHYLQFPAVYPFGIDSCQRCYFVNFKGFDSVLYKVIAYGDTAKYIRVYFTFVIDKYGAPYDVHFEKIASTQYAKSITVKLLTYFTDRTYYSKRIQEMMYQMPLWKPALLNGLAVDCRIHDYLQFWVGINPTRY